jgi:polyvinyl alcohol dehydrogenase (cytochrome)
LGTQLWGPSGAAVWSAPTVDLRARRVYVTTGDNYSDPATGTSDAFLAFDLDTGRLLWSRQTTVGDGYNMSCNFPPPADTNCPQVPGHDFDFGSSAILVSLPSGGRALMAGQKSGVVYSVDPDRAGEILWHASLGRGGTLGGIQWGSAADGNHLYVALSDAKVALVSPGTPGAQPSAFGPPLLEQDRSQRVLAAVQRLPLAYRQVASLILEDFEPAEIAHVLGLNVNAVAIRSTRARALLRLSLGE